MDVFSLLSYINRVSLLAFFVTTLVVGYQIYILKKEKSKEHAPSIPDFKEKIDLNMVVNYTSLPATLTKKEIKAVNYSKLIFFVISLLTIIVVIFVVSLIKKNNIPQKEALNNQAPTEEPTPMKVIPTEIIPTDITPTIVAQTAEPSIDPTEIVIASDTSSAQVNNPTEVVVNNKLQVLPETGNLGKELFIIGVAISTIFFSFWF